jgi:hypothetical protein
MFDPDNKNTLHTISDPASRSHSTYQSRSNSQLEKYPRSGRKSRLRGLWGFLAALILVLLLVVGSISLGNNPNYSPPAQLQQFPEPVLFLMVFGAILLLALLLRIIFRRTPLPKFLVVTIGLSLFAFVTVALLLNALINPYVGMTRTSFLRNSVSISNGDTLHFQNPSDGVTQTLCIGVDQKCQPESGAPGALNHGIQIQPGQSITITFNTDGTYHITSSSTPGMNLSIDVSTPEDSGVY